MNVLAIKTDQIYIIYKNFGRGMENMFYQNHKPNCTHLESLLMENYHIIVSIIFSCAYGCLEPMYAICGNGLGNLEYYYYPQSGYGIKMPHLNVSHTKLQ